VAYTFAQCLGAICGAGMVRIMTPALFDKVDGGANEISKNANATESLGVEFDEVDEIIERRPLERTIELPIGTFEAGTQGAFRLQVRGLVGGEEKIVMDHVTRIDDECALDWPVPPEQSMGCHQVLVTGDPDVALTLTAEDADGDRNVGGIAMSAGRIVHALHAVADAPNRIITAMDLPLIPGKGLLK